MAICDPEPVGLGLEVESVSPVPSSIATDTQETFNAEVHNLKLEENPETKSDEPVRSKPKEEPEEKLVTLSEEKSEEKDQEVAVVEEEKREEKDQEVAVIEEEKDLEDAVVGEDEKLEKDLVQSNEVKADGWGWDQDFAALEGNQNFEENPEWTSEVKVEACGWDLETGGSEEKVEACGWDLETGGSEEKVEAWGWDLETGGSEENAKCYKGSESWIEEKGQRSRSPFPQRPNEPDCSFFVKTGMCRYGLNCKFNHPPIKMRNNKMKFRKLPESAQAVELNGNGVSSEMIGQTEREKAYKERKMGTPSESNGQMDCKYYSTPGGCKYGSACKYNHKEKTEVLAKLNFLGLPMRPGEKECTYYMSTGSCKYSTNCRFHHPDPIAVGGQDTSSGYPNGGSPQPRAPPAQLPMTSWPVQQTPTEPVPFLHTSSPYVTGYFLPPQGLHPNPEWSGYQVPPPVNPLFPAEMNLPHPSAANMKDTMRMGNGSAPRTAPDSEYPERPGQAECSFFLKTGTCKFKSACKFHHPKSRLPKTSVIGVDVSPVGLPLRPDQPVCTHYGRHGICKFGRSCRYNHPMDSNPSVSPAAVTQSSDKVFPETSIDSLEVKTEVSVNPVQESEW